MATPRRVSNSDNLDDICVTSLLTTLAMRVWVRVHGDDEVLESEIVDQQYDYPHHEPLRDALGAVVDAFAEAGYLFQPASYDELARDEHGEIPVPTPAATASVNEGN